jgi:ADP-ribosylglycohydrolase
VTGALPRPDPSARFPIVLTNALVFQAFGRGATRFSFGNLQRSGELVLKRRNPPRLDNPMFAALADGCSRRTFLQLNAGFLGAAACWGQTPARTLDRRRIEGLLIGTYLGDALGGPVEFQPLEQVHALANPPKAWRSGERLNAAALAAAAQRVQLRSYRDLRPVPEPYAHWSNNAEPGTITDDSRHKLILLAALRQADQHNKWPVTAQSMAQAYLDWPRNTNLPANVDYAAICDEWLTEIRYAARWTLGERRLELARPQERLWNGLPTCCGQMTFPPLAVIFSDEPEAAYLAAYQLAFIDNGWGRDLNAAIVAGLATSLTTTSNPQQPATAWKEIFAAMRTTDPLGYSKVPWTERSIDRWLNFTESVVKQSQGEPAKLFALLDAEFGAATKWEAQVCFVAAFAPLLLCEYDPLAALALSIEWGHDTDSYAQLLGAFLGALHGPDIFPAALRTQVTNRLRLDYGEELSEQVELLARLREKGNSSALFAW